MKVVLVKITLTVVLAGFLAGCAGAPLAPAVNQGDGHIVQGGEFTAEGMMYFPLALPQDKK